MTRESITKTPAHNDAVKGADPGPSPSGIDWINLMLISEHPQPDVREPEKGGRPAPRWLFRIELDTLLEAAEIRELERLLREEGDFEGAGRYLLSVRTGADTTTQEFITAAFRNAASPTTPALTPHSTAGDEVVVQVIEDFGKGPKHKKAARAQFDVGLRNSHNLDALRDSLTNDPEGAKDELHRVIGARDRPKHVVTAALADD